ncbi:type III-B CRISPR module RAMP protein Cmr1 [Desulfoscipio gibsoniae]
MNTLQATYQVVTPLFMGGAGPNTVGLRAPSFKGVLRFWFRAIALSFLQSWPQVQQKEREFFGSTEGQARFMLSLRSEANMNIIDPGQRWGDQGSAYLGYGLIGGNKNTRPYIAPSSRFTVSIVLRPQGREQEQELADYLKRALIALGLFGGMGSRSRRGFGSLSLESLLDNGREIWTTPGDVNELKNTMQNFFTDMKMLDKVPEYSAFSVQSRVSIVKTENNALKLLDAVGREMIRYRSYGMRKRGQNNYTLPWGDGEDALQSFSDDHDNVWQVASCDTNPNVHPRRLVFGLPHNYRFSRGFEVRVNPGVHERRASPLFIHLHELSGQYAAVMTVLPAHFLPEGEDITLSNRRTGNNHTVEQAVDFNVLYEFINRFRGRLEVRP